MLTIIGIAAVVVTMMALVGLTIIVRTYLYDEREGLRSLKLAAELRECRLYRNKKTGNLYRTIAVGAIETNNGRHDGRLLVIYAAAKADGNFDDAGEQHIFVRSVTEFHAKFERA